MPSKFLTDFETLIRQGPANAARALGVGYSTYAAYRSMTRELPVYHARHIHALQLLPASALKSYLREALK